MLAMMEVAPRPARAGLAGIHSRRLRGLPVQGKPVRLNPVRENRLSRESSAPFTRPGPAGTSNRAEVW